MEIRTLVDINHTYSEDLPKRFHLYNSDHTFTWVKDSFGAVMVLDLDDNIVYRVYEIECQYYDFNFWTKNDDDNFLGIEPM